METTHRRARRALRHRRAQPRRRRGRRVVLVHGAGGDRTVWQLQTRWIAHHGYRAAAARPPRPRRQRGTGSRRASQRWGQWLATDRRRSGSGAGAPGGPLDGDVRGSGGRGAAARGGTIAGAAGHGRRHAGASGAAGRGRRRRSSSPGGSSPPGGSAAGPTPGATPLRACGSSGATPRCWTGPGQESWPMTSPPAAPMTAPRLPRPGCSARVTLVLGREDKMTPNKRAASG